MLKWLMEPAADSVTHPLLVIAERTRSSVKTRVSSFVYVASCYAVVGYPNEALLFLLGLVIVEGLLAYSYPKSFKSDETVLNLDAVRFALVELTSTIFFTSLGLFAAFSNSVSMVVVGLLWIVGVLNYTSINFAKWQYFNAINVAPVAGGLVLYACLIGSEPLREPTLPEWIMGIIATLLLLKTTQELIIDQRKIEDALESARQDADERLEALQYASSRDDLTGLLNRSAFNDRLQQQLERSQENNKPFGFLLLDLDGFKPINDGFGHPAGDSVLIEVSARLVNTVGNKGFVARVGGDEFSVVLSKIGKSDELEDIALDLIRVIGLPVKCKDQDLSVGVSIGAAIVSDQLNTAERIIAAADEALYEAKENQKSSYVQYHPNIVRRRVPIEERAKMERAIKERLIKPYYQPKFCLKTQEIVGYEALARWPLDSDDPADSAYFVSTIEELGLLGEFTYQMARQVFTDVTSLLNLGYDPGQVSLNLSEVTLATVNGLEDLQWLLAENAPVVPHITLEITEDVFIARSGARIRESIAELRAIGVRISLDDFGTGFASFQHLRQLDFDEMKIDTEFVRNLGIDLSANVIVDGFLSIAQGLGVSVVAEGVETEAQRQYLLERGCPVGQGFLFAKAVPFSEVRALLAANAQKKVG